MDNNASCLTPTDRAEGSLNYRVSWPRPLLHGLGHTAPIAIAVFALSYFAAVLVSWAGAR